MKAHRQGNLLRADQFQLILAPPIDSRPSYFTQPENDEHGTSSNR
jgi:hypothetical protein